MVGLVLAVLIVVLVVSLARLAARSPRPRFGWPALWRFACLIGAVRIGALWVGNAAYRTPGWAQGFGYLLQLLGVPEIYLAKGARADTIQWLLLASTLLAAGSLGWAALFVWVGNRVRPPLETH